MSIFGLVVIFCVSLFLSGIFSMLEAAIISQDKHRLQHLADENDKRAQLMQRLLKRTDHLLSTLLLCNNLANVTCAASATAIATLLMPGGEAIFVWVTLIVTFLLLVFSEITPKVIGVRYASAVALALVRLVGALVHILSPLTGVANFFSNCLLWLIGIKNNKRWDTAMNLKELRSAVRAAARTSDSTPDTQDHYSIVENTLRFNELTVEKIMTPRAAIEAINLNDDVAAIIRQIENTTHNKLPLFAGNIDEAGLVVTTLNAIKYIKKADFSAARLTTIGEPVYYVPAASTALQQLQNMRRQQQNMALVIDGNGRVAGMLTYADFTRAIIGEETPPPAQRQDGGWLMPGDTPLLQLEQLQQGVAIPEDIEAATLNGMILDYLGDLPDRPLCLSIGGWNFEIVSVDDKVIRDVIVYPPPPPAEEAMDEEE